MICGLILVNVALASDTVLQHFTSEDGSGQYPYGDLILGPGGYLYGMTRSGGLNGFGTIFKILPNGTDYSIFHHFAASDGTSPEGGLTLVGDTLYGMTTGGGTYEHGTIFKITWGAFKVIHSFDDDNKKEGCTPKGSLTYYNGYLYGTANLGGENEKGTIFMISKDATTTTDLTFIYSFDEDANGINPLGTPTLSSNGTTLYGITSLGGKNDNGTIFSITGGIFKLIHAFTGEPSGASSPKDSPILSTDNGTLYGMTNTGGSKNKGTIFKITPTEGAEIEVIHSFTGSTTDGAKPYGSLTLSGQYLYGMTSEGGSGNKGTIFRIPTNATSETTITIIHSFEGTLNDGANPYYGSLILDGTTLYGTTRKGGGYDFGTIFSAQIPSPVLSVTPSTQSVTAAAGTTTFDVTNTGTGSMSWTAAVTEGSSWLSCTPSNSTLSCFFAENTDTSSRTGTITVTAAESNTVSAADAQISPMAVTVTQAGTTPTEPAPCSLSISPYNPSVTGDAGTATYDVSNAAGYTNISWTATVWQGGDWFTITSGAAGTNSGTITCAFTANPSTIVARTAYIGIVPSDGSCEGHVGIMVTQNPVHTSTTLLWTKTDGTAWVWSLDTPGNLLSSKTYGPFSDWAAQGFHKTINSDGTAQMLWDHIDGTASVWFMNDMGDMGSMEYGPETGWTAVSYHLNSDATANMLWVHVDGTASVWTLNNRGNITSRMLYGPYTEAAGTWTAADFRRYSDGTANMLWVRSDAYTSVWTLDSSGNMTSRIHYGPYPGWVPRNFDKTN